MNLLYTRTFFRDMVNASAQKVFTENSCWAGNSIIHSPSCCLGKSRTHFLPWIATVAFRNVAVLDSINIYNFLTDFSTATMLPVWPVLDCSLRVGTCDTQTLRFLADTLFHGKHSSICVPHSGLKTNHGTRHISQKSSGSTYSFHKKCLCYTHDCMPIVAQFWKTMTSEAPNTLV